MRKLSGKTCGMALVLSVFTGLLSSCATDAATATAGSGGRCDDSGLAWAIGQPGDQANMARLWKESGAGLMNPIAPTTVVKRDSRADRLRVYLDKDNVITAARCE